MTDSLAAWASWRVSTNDEKSAEDLDRLRVEAKHAGEMLASKGWAFLQRWLALKQAQQVNVLASRPGGEPVDAYALKHAYAAGYLNGLQHAYDTPNALVTIAEQELAWAQKASEELARRQENQ